MNTTLHATHPLLSIASDYPDIRFVGQHPADVEKYEDKAWCNSWLAGLPELSNSIPRSKLAHRGQLSVLRELGLPVVLKPVRGRGSHGVTVVDDDSQLDNIAKDMWEENEAILLEEYLAGEEITVSVMPPGDYQVSLILANLRHLADY